MRDDDIYAPENKYGYQVDITNPKIKPLYERFKKWKGIADWCPLSDAERFEFESYILKGGIKAIVKILTNVIKSDIIYS